MKRIHVIVGFTNTSGGLVHVVIQGTSSNYNYDVDGTHAPDNRDFHLFPGLYLIKVHGLTGGSCYLKVTGDIDLPINENAGSNPISISKPFIVQ